MNQLFPAILLTAGLGAGSSAGETVATIALYNPTGYRGPIMIEISTGRIAAPGIIDWRRARLMAGEEEIPFAIRAGGGRGGRRSAAGRLERPGNRHARAATRKRRRDSVRSDRFIRGGGFGGGNFEVDFPYGPDQEWERSSIVCSTRA